MENREIKISVKGLKKCFGELEVLKGMDVEVKEGEVVCLIGPSGSGKSTFLRCLNRLEEANGGEIVIDGQTITDKKININKVRENIGMVFQHFNLFANLTILDNITLAPVELKILDKVEAKNRALELLRRVGLEDKANVYPSQLSGGQKQRVAIARALANDPNILLCDEATSALDPTTTKSILQLLKKLNRELGITMVVITHEMAVVKEICQRVAVMEEGKIVEEGDVFSVFANPQQEITKNFVRTTSNLQKVEELIAEDSPVTRIHQGEVILRLTYVEKNISEPLLSEVSEKFHVTDNIIFADIAIIDDAPVGGTVAIFDGTAEHIEQAIAYLKEKNVKVEVIKDERVSD